MRAPTTQRVVRRRKALWQDRVRDDGVMVDGQPVATVAHGAEVAVTPSSAPHRVHLAIDGCRLPPLDFVVPSEGAVRLDCGANAHSLLALLHISLWSNRCIWLARAPGG